MGNPFSMARMRSIFSAPETEDQKQKRFLSGVSPFGPKRPDSYSSIFTTDTVDPPSPETPAVGDDDDDLPNYMKEAARLQSGNGPALTAYQNELKYQPQYEDYKPGTGRRIGATLAAAMSGYGGGVGAGLATGSQILDAPYATARSEYNSKIRNMAASAKLEETQNKNSLNSLAQARALGLKYDQYKLREAEVNGKQKVAETNAATSRDRAKAWIAKQGRKGYKYTQQEDGSLLATNTSDPADVYTVPAKTIAAAQLKVNRRNADSTAANSATAASNATSLAEFRKGDLKIRGEKEARLGKTGKTVAPSQQAYARDNALRELFSDPRFNKFVIQSDKGTFEATVDDKSLMYQEFKKRLKRLTEASILSKVALDDDDDSDADIEIGAPR